MAIKNIHQHFLDIVKADQKSAEDLASLFRHELEFPKVQVSGVIFNSTVKTLKNNKIFEDTRPSKRRGGKDVKLKPFELSERDKKNFESKLDELCDNAYDVVYDNKNIETVYSKHFKQPLKFNKEGFLEFPVNVYAKTITPNTKSQARHKSQRDLATQAVKHVLKEFRKYLKGLIDYEDQSGSGGGEASTVRRDVADKLTGAEKISTRGVDSHGTQTAHTTVALINATMKLAELDKSIESTVSAVLKADKNNIVETTRNRMLEVFSDFEVEGQKLTDIAQEASRRELKVEDLITIKLQHGTDEFNQAQSEKDRKKLSDRLDEIAKKQLEKLEKSGLDKTSERYKFLKGSKSFEERLEDGALNITIDEVEGIQKISKLLKGVKVTSGKKVKAKKKTKASKTSRRTVTKGKIKNRKVAKTVKKVGLTVGATGRYNPRNAASETSLAALMQIINRSLPRHLKGNMEPPALQYRGQGNPSRPFAGPFNTGVRLTSLRNLKKVQGGLQVNYTYEKYPYQTFEPGFEQGSIQRDPRQLIQESIRDIMIERKQTRFLNFRRY